MDEGQIALGRVEVGLGTLDIVVGVGRGRCHICTGRLERCSGGCNIGRARIDQAVEIGIGFGQIELCTLPTEIALCAAPVVLDFDLGVIDLGLLELIGHVAQIELGQHHPFGDDVIALDVDHFDKAGLLEGEFFLFDGCDRAADLYLVDNISDFDGVGLLFHGRGGWAWCRRGAGLRRSRASTCAEERSENNHRNYRVPHITLVSDSISKNNGATEIIR